MAGAGWKRLQGAGAAELDLCQAGSRKERHDTPAALPTPTISIGEAMSREPRFCIIDNKRRVLLGRTFSTYQMAKDRAVTLNTADGHRGRYTVSEDRMVNLPVARAAR